MKGNLPRTMGPVMMVQWRAGSFPHLLTQRQVSSVWTSRTGPGHSQARTPAWRPRARPTTRPEPVART
eukprot:gene11422-biopygen13930